MTLQCKNLKSTIHELSAMGAISGKPETGVIAYQCNDLEVRSVGCIAKNVQLAFIGKNMKHVDPNTTSSIHCKTPYIRDCDKYDVEKRTCCDTKYWFDNA